tara:strand:- start:1177 stop:1461 length:285 start_codon:yes stop_codon:yes gene_type:complete
MAKIDLDGDGKADVSISLPQIITIAAMFASIVGSYYTLSAKIDSNTAEVTKLKYNEKEYTWKNQRELEKEVREITLEMRDFMKDLEYLKKGKKR